jgi:hypothetical protein
MKLACEKGACYEFDQLLVHGSKQGAVDMMRRLYLNRCTDV